MKHFPIYILFTMLLLSGCRQLSPLLQRTERTKYEGSFPKNDSLLNLWKTAHHTAMANPLELKLPYLATLKIVDPQASALVYRITIKQGQQLVAEISKQTDSTGVLLEFFSSNTSSSGKLLAELHTDSTKITWSAQQDDSIRVSLQPLLQDSSVHHLKLYIQPAYHFPVLSKDNRAIQSFWGADRDGGARRHEGIDIFASRGTPALAVADGRVSFAGERGSLGGKQVWLHENTLGFHVYYAHLDSIMIQSNQTVSIGDTVGFVGNTGNAAGGPPHLHFGVYGKGGAVDPLNFVKKINIPSASEYDFTTQTILTKNTILRTGPSNSYPTRLSLHKGEPVKIVARSGIWSHAIVRDSIHGFLPK